MYPHRYLLIYFHHNLEYICLEYRDKALQKNHLIDLNNMILERRIYQDSSMTQLDRVLLEIVGLILILGI